MGTKEVQDYPNELRSSQGNLPRVPIAPFRWDKYDSVCRDSEDWIIGWEEMMQIANAVGAERDRLRERVAELVAALDRITIYAENARLTMSEDIYDWRGDVEKLGAIASAALVKERL